MGGSNMKSLRTITVIMVGIFLAGVLAGTASTISAAPHNPAIHLVPANFSQLAEQVKLPPVYPLDGDMLTLTERVAKAVTVIVFVTLI